MESYEPYVSLGLALAAGLLVGLEREQSAAAPSDAPSESDAPPETSGGSKFGGARTYPLIALVGALGTLAARQLGVFAWIAAFAGVLVLVGIAYADDVRRRADRGLTSEVASLVTFLLGSVALTEGIVQPLSRKIFVVLSAAVIVTMLLSVKRPLHRLIAKTSKEEVLATVKFLLIAVVVLPNLPDRTFGPLDVLNPFQIGMMIVLIAGISFVGYVASRALGAGRGLSVTGIVGGLVSSTAVTLSFSRRAKSSPELAPACALAIVLASTIMFGRVLVEVAVVNASLVRVLALPLAAMALACLVAAAVLYRQSRDARGDGGDLDLKNPFELGSAVKFGLLFALVLFVSKAATKYFGASGTYLASLLAGTTDVDAITLSMARLAKGGLDAKVAVTAILISVVSNTMVKAGLAASLGGWALGRKIFLSFAIAAAAGAAGIASIWLVA